MRYFLICDNSDTLTGHRMAGIEGVIASEKHETETLIKQCIADESIAVLLITEQLAALCPPLINDLRLNAHRPLVVVIPNRHGTSRPTDSITQYIREAIGVKLS